MGSEESSREEAGCGGNENVDVDVWSYKAGSDTMCRNQSRRGDESAGKEVEVVWVSNEKRR